MTDTDTAADIGLLAQQQANDCRGCPASAAIARAESALRSAPPSGARHDEACRRLRQAHQQHDAAHRLTLLADDIRQRVARQAVEDHDRAFAEGQRHAYVRMIAACRDTGHQLAVEHVLGALSRPDDGGQPAWLKTGRRDQQDAERYRQALAELGAQETD